MLWKWGLCAGRTVCACVRVRIGVCWGEGGGEEEDERLKVTDVSSLTMRNMISSLPVIQMYRPWHPSSEQFKPRCCLYKQSPVCLLENWEQTHMKPSPTRRLRSGNKLFKSLFFAQRYFSSQAFFFFFFHLGLQKENSRKSHGDKWIQKEPCSAFFLHDWKIRRSGPAHLSSFRFLLRQDSVVSESN